MPWRWEICVVYSILVNQALQHSHPTVCHTCTNSKHVTWLFLLLIRFVMWLFQYDTHFLFLNVKNDVTYQWRIQDFPQGGRQLPKVLLFFNFLPKNCMKMKEFGPPGGGRASLAPPLGSANAYCWMNRGYPVWWHHYFHGSSIADVTNVVTCIFPGGQWFLSNHVALLVITYKGLIYINCLNLY